MQRRPTCLAAAAAVVGATALAAGLLTGCAPTIAVPVADDAANPQCAAVVLALPTSLGFGLPSRETTSQATAAWGRPGAAVTLRCGVAVPGPTTTACVHVEPGSAQNAQGAGAEPAPQGGTQGGTPGGIPDGTQGGIPGDTPDAGTTDSGGVDWLVAEDGDGAWTFTTYGRDPAVEVIVPPGVTATHSTSFVADLGPAINRIPATRSCVGAADSG